MLSPWFKAIGIGRAYDSSSTYDWYWTTDFGGYVDGLGLSCPPNSSPTNTPVPSATPTRTPTSQPTSTPTRTPTPQSTPTNTPVSQPSATNTPTPQATATNTPPPQPTATNTPQPTATTAPVVSVYVTGMTGKAATKRGTTTLSVTATIKDTRGLAVSGAAVTIELVAPDGSRQSLSATTNSRGQASWSVKATGGSGSYVANVKAVEAGSRTYNAGMNATSSVEMTVP